MDRKEADNYDEVNMDMSDSDSDNEMFANKAEYDAFKKDFSSKTSSGTSGVSGTKPAVTTGEYGGAVEDASSEYGGGCDRISVVGTKLSSAGAGSQPEGPGETERSQASMVAGERKVERRPMMYSDNKKEKERSPPRHRQRSRSRGRRSRSRSEDDRRRRSRSSSRDGKRRRSRNRKRSRSPNRDRDGGRHRDRGGWGGRDRGRDRRREREEEGVKNHEDQLRKAKELGVEIPRYIKPGAVNPLSYASQMQKRKQLWAKPAAASAPAEEKPVEAKAEVIPAAGAGAKPGGSYNNWESTNFGNDKVNEKFRRLMGIKGDSKPVPSSEPSSEQTLHTKIMHDLDVNYEAARQQTHRNRGMGMGFSDAAQYQTQPALVEQPPPPPPGTTRNLPWQNRNLGGMNFVRKQ